MQQLHDEEDDLHLRDVRDIELDHLQVPQQRRHRESDADSSDGLTGIRPATIRREKKVYESVLRDGWGSYIKKSCSELFLSSKMNILLFAVPFAFIANHGGWSDGIVFILCLLALCPLAERLSFVTEEIAKYTNDTIGGLLNATFGNATEVIVSVFALKAGLIRVVQVSLVGSIFSNLLLVLGTAFLVGGVRFDTQRYNKTAANVNTTLLLLAVMAILFPATLHAAHDEAHGEKSRLFISRFSSICLLFSYGLLILYQIKTHSHLFEGQEESNEDEDEDDEPVLGMWGSIFWCSIITILIAILSEFIVAAIEGAAEDLGMPILFIGTILLPIVGNAAEHASAIIFAYRNKMEIALGIAVGSATQIALFVIPLLVVIGWCIDQPMSMDFHVFETCCLLITVVLVNAALSHGESDYLKGVTLLIAYAILSACFWVHSDPSVDDMDVSDGD